MNSAGHFRCSSSGLERFAELPALQITLQKGRREARGWVHNDMYLSMSRRRRLTAGALSRLMRREATDDDLEALLEYLAVSAHNHIRTFSVGFTSTKSEGDASPANSDTVHISVENIAPVENFAEPGGASHQATVIPLDNFEIAMSRLRRMLLGHGKERSQAASADRSHAVMGEDADEYRDGNPSGFPRTLFTGRDLSGSSWKCSASLAALTTNQSQRAPCCRCFSKSGYGCDSSA